MKYAFFSVPVLDPNPVAEDLNRFCASHRVTSVEKQLVAEQGRHVWAFCVGYLDGAAQPGSEKKGRVDYRAVLNAEDFALFAKLRSLRKALAERDGVPAYALFTNEQLAEMARQRVDSKAALGDIEGVGDARIEKYAEPFLELLRQSGGQTPAQDDTP